MATDKQIQTNRENARHSTGPRTPEGKARSAANRTTHALTGRHTVLPSESPADFNQLLTNLQDEWNPQSETESQQVELLAHHWWRLLRIARLENDAFARPLAIRQQLALTDEVERISRYEVRIRRAYHQAIETLRKLQQPPAPHKTRNVNTNPIPVHPPPTTSAAVPRNQSSPDIPRPSPCPKNPSRLPNTSVRHPVPDCASASRRPGATQATALQRPR